MKIWVDADACPVAIKEILYRAANRASIQTTLISNQNLTVPNSPFIQRIQVPSGFDIADNKIVELLEDGDIVITSDIPLANDAIELGALVLSFRGDRFTPENIKSRLNIRDFMETMRSSGMQTGGPPAFNHTDRQNFANALDRLITSHKKQLK